MTSPARTARLARYALWQGLDFAREKGLAIALILAALTVGTVSLTTSGDAPTFRGPGGAANLARFTFQLISSISTALIVISFTGLSGFDRAQGFTRFYFAKPLVPSAFYAQKWVVHLACLSLIVAVWLGLLAAVYGPFDVGPTLQAFVLRTVLYGGVIFLLSALVSADIAAFSGVFLGGELLNILAGDRVWATNLVLWVFPWRRFSDIDARLVQQVTLPLPHVAHIVGVGLGCVVAGVFVLRSRRLTQ